MTYTVIAEREDGSTCSGAFVADVAAFITSRLLKLPVPPVRVTLVSDDARNGVQTDCGPILPLEQALVWRQPKDKITELLRHS